MNIHVSQKGQQLGPFSLEQIQKMTESGMISPETLAWVEGQTQWKPLKHILGMLPPPLPPIIPPVITDISVQFPHDPQQGPAGFTVAATSVRQACEVITSNLAPFFEHGWKIKTAVALADGWRNSYTLTRAGEQRVVDFDLRPTLPALTASDRFKFTATSMVVGLGQTAELLRLLDDPPSQPLLSRSQWKLRVREAEIALDAWERHHGTAYVLGRYNLAHMKANPPKEYGPEHCGIRAALGRFLASIFPHLMDGFIIREWRAGRSPRLPPLLPGMEAAAHEALASIGSASIAAKPPTIHEPQTPTTGLHNN